MDHGVIVLFPSCNILDCVSLLTSINALTGMIAQVSSIGAPSLQALWDAGIRKILTQTTGKYQLGSSDILGRFEHSVLRF